MANTKIKLIYLTIFVFLRHAIVGSSAASAPSTVHSPTRSPNSISDAQYVHDKEDTKSTDAAVVGGGNDDTEHSRLLNALKQPQYLPPPPVINSFLPPSAPWNSFPHYEDIYRAQRYYTPPPPAPFYGNPYVMPYPYVLPSEYFYPSPYPVPQTPEFSEYEELESRSNVRGRPSAYRNSPVYYIRLPPTPYMFVPGIGYTSQPPSFTPNFTPVLPYSPAIPAYAPQHQPMSPLLNLPLNFLANGKPGNIYTLDANLGYGGHPYQTYYAQQRPSYRPQYGLPTSGGTSQQPTSQSSSQQTYGGPSDSKITHLKRPYFFNGRPDDVYMMQNSYNPIYPNPITGYY